MSAEQLTYSGHAEMTVTEMKAGSIFGNKFKIQLYLSDMDTLSWHILEPISNPGCR